MLPVFARAFLLFGASALVLTQPPRPGVERTLHIVATDDRGNFPGDLTAADLAVKEGGAVCEVRRVEPSITRLKVCLAIDEGISPDARLRQAALRFVQQIRGSGDVSLALVGPGRTTLVDYTSDLAPFVRALSSLPLRAQGDGNLVESLYEIARGQRRLEGRRAIVVIATESPQRVTVTADGVLDELTHSGIVLHVVTLVGPAGTAPVPTPEMAHLETIDDTERDRLLNDGPRDSGGVRRSALRLDAIGGELDRVRDALLNQYAVTYVVPAGTKSDGRVVVTASRPGVTIRAPRRVPKI